MYVSIYWPCQLQIITAINFSAASSEGLCFGKCKLSVPIVV